MKSDFKKKGIFEKIYLKIADPKGYKKYKHELKEQKWCLALELYLASHKSKSVASLKELNSIRQSINVVHSGNSGDIIYSLATLKKITQITGKRCRLFLKLDQPLSIGDHYSHPLGQVMLNAAMARMLKPLIEFQPYIENCESYSNQNIDLDLDRFRNFGLMLDRGDIGRWCAYPLGINPELHIEWLNVKEDKTLSNSIVIARSERYRNPYIDYSFLREYKDVVFLGVESEYKDIKKFVPEIQWIKVDDFLQLAQIIKSCKFFIGNQSFPFSVAEGLKVPRILETYVFSPNVIPQGSNGYDFYLQSHFEDLVEALNNG